MLEERGLDTKGTKPFLVERLKAALEAEQAQVKKSSLFLSFSLSPSVVV